MLMKGLRSRLYFALMTLVFAIRDRIWPPENILRAVGVQPGQAFLDFGCGPGGYTIAAARLVGPTGTVYALDIDPLALKAVRRKATKANLANVETILADSTAELPAQSLDVALMHDVLHFIKDRQDLIADIARVLRPGGVFAVSDHHLREAVIASIVTSGRLFALSRSLDGMLCFRCLGTEAGR